MSRHHRGRRLVGVQHSQRSPGRKRTPPIAREIDRSRKQCRERDHHRSFWLVSVVAMLDDEARSAEGGQQQRQERARQAQERVHGRASLRPPPAVASATGGASALCQPLRYRAQQPGYGVPASRVASQAMPAHAVLLVIASAMALAGAEISVGPGRGLTRLEDAFPLAKPGDSIIVHARADGQPYARTALRLTLPGLTLRGMPDSSGKRPVLDGAGATFAAGDQPRAIIVIGPEAVGATVAGFHLTGAGAAAGIYIDGADQVTIDDCEITACDRGLVSVGSADTAREVLVSSCHIHHNATDNVVLGGGGGRLVGCAIHHAIAGRNLVSRAHRTVLEASWVHDAAAAEIDLLDEAGVSDRAGGLMLVLGCVLAKRRDCPGNRSVIRCGQDRGGDRVGIIHIVHSTVITPYAAAVVELTAPGAKAAFANCIVADPTGGGSGRMLVARDGLPVEPTWAGGLWLAYGYQAPRGAAGVTNGAFSSQPPFVDHAAGDVRLRADAGVPFIDSALPLANIPLPVSALTSGHPLRQRPPVLLGFRSGKPAGVRKVVGSGLDLGAYEAEPQ